MSVGLVHVLNNVPIPNLNRNVKVASIFCLIAQPHHNPILSLLILVKINAIRKVMVERKIAHAIMIVIVLHFGLFHQFILNKIWIKV